MQFEPDELSNTAPPDEAADERLTQALRAALPAPSSHLRGRILRACQQQHSATRSRQRRANWRLAGAVICLLLIQGGAVAYLDAQRTRLLWPAASSVPAASPLVALGPTPAEYMSRTLATRSRTIAWLLSNRDEPGYSKETSYDTKSTSAPAGSPVHAAPTVRNG